MIWNLFELMPRRLKPSCKMASTSTPSQSPITVPEPPSMAVPPMTTPARATRTTASWPALGSMMLFLKASRIPASAPNPAHNMKLPILIRLTLMPASRAPSRLPPTEIVYRPQRVLVRITWKIRTRTVAQMISDHASPPNQRPTPSDPSGRLICWAEETVSA